METWTEADIQTAVSTLEKVGRSFRENQFPKLPEAVFFALLRNHLSVSAECAIIRYTEGRPEALWIQRPASDPFYPLLWHFPGGRQFPGTPLVGVARQTIYRETGLYMEVRDIGNYDNPHERTGHNCQHLFFGEVPSTVTVRTEAGLSHSWVPVFGAPPDQIVESHGVLLRILQKHLQR